MPELMLRSHQFRKEREHIWKELERLIAKGEGRGLKALNDEEMIALPVLYRGALSSLSVAREISLDQSVVSYLESLSARAYFLVYGTRTTVRKRVAEFFIKHWPEAVAKLWKETLANSAIVFIFALTAYFLILGNSDWFYSLTPQGLMGDRTPTASTEHLRSTLYHDAGAEGLGFFSARLFTHNSGVAILSFALGFALCLPTAFLMGYTGTMLGGFMALFASRGLGVEAGGWLFIHGTTEIFAIILAGAAGFHIGLAVAFPGDRNRFDAAVDAGRTGATVLGGVIIMLAFAGLLEGFGRQLINSTPVRYSVGTIMLALWMAYFYWPRHIVLEDER